MIVCKNIEQLRAQVKAWRNKHESIAFVPTMGNLHDGHLSLVALAQQKAKHVVVSIYVNPMQFSPDEDFASYPRTLNEDLKQLDAVGVELVFTPDSSIIYPDGELQSSFAEVPVLSQMLEGECRPGFFKGVSTVVLKLFNMVQPDYAVFGEKDFQQLLIIKQMVKDFNLPIEIVAAATKREADGLAMSSRNNYLNASNREKSRFLSQALKVCCDQIQQGVDIEQAEKTCIDLLQNHGFSVDYVTLRETNRLQKVSSNDITINNELIVLVAAKIGDTRLIDNIKFVITD